jgi:hypothetical protein
MGNRRSVNPIGLYKGPRLRRLMFGADYFRLLLAWRFRVSDGMIVPRFRFLSWIPGFLLLIATEIGRLRHRRRLRKESRQHRH